MGTTKQQMVKVPAEVLALFSSLLRASLAERPTKTETNAAYLSRDTTYVKRIRQTNNSITVVDSGDHITTIPIVEEISLATQTTPGLMSAFDKLKLDELDPNMQEYVLPSATASRLGGVKIGSNIEVHSGMISVKDADEIDAGVAHLYDNAEGENADGAITQRAAVTAIKNLLQTINILTARLEEAEGKLTGIFRYKGSVEYYSNLPTTYLAVGDTYSIEKTDANASEGAIFAWTGDKWTSLKGVVDLSSVLSKEEMTAIGNNLTAKLEELT